MSLGGGQGRASRPQRCLLRANHRLTLFTAGVLCTCARLCSGSFPEVCPCSSSPVQRRLRPIPSFLSSWTPAFQSLSEEAGKVLSVRSGDGGGPPAGKKRKVASSPQSLLSKVSRRGPSLAAMAMATAGGVKSDTEEGVPTNRNGTAVRVSYQVCERRAVPASGSGSGLGSGSGSG